VRRTTLDRAASWDAIKRARCDPPVGSGLPRCCLRSPRC
jgi:hypothetical protein